MGVGKIGKLHVVFSRKKADPKILGLATDDPTPSACQIIQSYWDDLTSYLKQFLSGDQIIKELGRLLVAA